MNNFKKMEKILKEGILPGQEELSAAQDAAQSQGNRYGSYQPLWYQRYYKLPRPLEQDKLQELYQDYSKAIQTVQRFIEAQAAQKGNDELVKVFDEFIHNLKKNGITGA